MRAIDQSLNGSNRFWLAPWNLAKSGKTMSVQSSFISKIRKFLCR